MAKGRRHQPQRRCVVCREVREKRDLTRLVWQPDEGVVLDETGRRPGRGAYLCGRVECWTHAAGGRKGSPVSAALRAPLDERSRERLGEEARRRAAAVEA